jgi:hypothetical protein
MKKTLLGILGLMAIFMLFGCHQVQKKMEAIIHPDHEKIEDVHGILNKILEHIADSNPKLSYEEGQLLDSELGIPHFEIVSILEIEHFKEKDIVAGFVVRPMVAVDNSELLIVVEAVDKKASASLNQAMDKVKSDQYERFKDAGILTRHLINNNETVRQGNFLIYVTWEKPEEIVKVFERHVR